MSWVVRSWLTKPQTLKRWSATLGLSTAQTLSSGSYEECLTTRRKQDPANLELGVEAVDAGAQVGVGLLRWRRPQGLHLQRAQRRVRRVGLQLLLRAGHSRASSQTLVTHFTGVGLQLLLRAAILKHPAESVVGTSANARSAHQALHRE